MRLIFILYSLFITIIVLSNNVFSLVTHDFKLVDNCENISRWTTTGGFYVSLNSVTYLEGDGAINIYKNSTSEGWGSAYLQFNQTIHPYLKLVVLYIYVTEDALKNIKRFAIYLYAPDNSWNSFGRLETLRPGWNAIVLPIKDTRLKNVVKIEFRFYAGYIPEGSFVVDRIMVGSGFYVVYSTESNPDTLLDVYKASLKDNLMLVDSIGKNGYVVRSRIIVGNGQDTGTLFIKDSVVLFDGVQLSEAGLFMGFIEVYSGSVLNVENSILVAAGRRSYPYQGMILRPMQNSIVKLKNSAILDLVPFITGGKIRYNFGTKYLTLYDVIFNSKFWMYTVKDTNITGNLIILPHGSMVLDDMYYKNAIFPARVFLLPDAEIVPRQSHNITFYDLVSINGNFRVDHSIGILINPLNINKDNLVLSPNSVIKVYYTVDINVVDRLGNTIRNATVLIYDKYGNLSFEGVTDESGHVLATLLVYEKISDSSGNIIADNDYNNFTIKVFVNDSLIAQTKIEVRNKMSVFVTPDNIYAVVAYPDKPHVELNEPLNIMANIYMIDGSPISGATVFANITKPNHESVIIQLHEVEPGLYSAEFNGTTASGKYYVTVTAHIGNATMIARTYFYAGKIENLLASALSKVLSPSFPIQVVNTTIPIVFYSSINDNPVRIRIQKLPNNTIVLDDYMSRIGNSSYYYYDWKPTDTGNYIIECYVENSTAKDSIAIKVIDRDELWSTSGELKSINNTINEIKNKTDNISNKLDNMQFNINGLRIIATVPQTVLPDSVVRIDIVTTDITGQLIDTDSIYVYVYDPTDRVYDKGRPVKISTGQYYFKSYISEGAPRGQYKVEVIGMLNNITSKDIASFRVEAGGPYDVAVIVENKTYIVGTKTVCADVKVYNFGSIGQDVRVHYWIEDQNYNTLSSSEFEVYTPPHLWVARKVCLPAPKQTGLYYFKVRVYYGEGLTKYAHDTFEIVATKVTPPPVSLFGGGLSNIAWDALIVLFSSIIVSVLIYYRREIFNAIKDLLRNVY